MARPSGNLFRVAIGATVAVTVVAMLFFSVPAQAQANGFEDIERIVQVQGLVQEGALLLRFPRTDIQVTIQSQPVSTTLGFVSWTAWKNQGDTTLLMGELVLLESEVNPVITALESSGISVAALHRHLMWEEPAVMSLHIQGVGKGIELARGIRAALDKTSTPRGSTAKSPESPVSLNIQPIQDITGHRGITDGGVFRIVVGRTGVRTQGVELTSVMGLNSWAGFGGTNQHAHVAGEIAATAAEVSRVIRCLRTNGLDVVAIHNNMLDDHPRMFFVNFWGTGPAERLALAIRSALEKVQGPVR